MTPHNRAEKGDIAKTVVMPGDPKRVKYIAENYLDNPVLVNDVRGILTYTGKYKGKDVTVMASGMGMASIGIYVTELFKFYDVDKVIRIGTCGGLKEDVKVNDIILAEKAYTTSNYAHSLTGKNTNIIASSEEMNKKVEETAKRLDIKIKKATINTSDIFYREYFDKSIEENNCIAVEMETFGLLFIAKMFNKEAASVLTVSDNVVTGEQLSPEEREKSLKNAILLVLESL